MSLSGNVFGFFLLFFQNGHGIIYGMDHRDFALKRSSAILFEKFLRYLLPAMLTMAALSLSVQSLSIVSIFLAAVLQATSPFVATLHGQKDFVGEKKILNIAFACQFIFAVLCVAYFVFFPNSFIRLYDVDEPDIIPLALTALKIFAGAGFTADMSLKSAVIIEEIAVFTKNRLQKEGYLDVLTLVDKEAIEINFRSLKNK